MPCAGNIYAETLRTKVDAAAAAANSADGYALAIIGNYPARVAKGQTVKVRGEAARQEDRQEDRPAWRREGSKAVGGVDRWVVLMVLLLMT